MIKIEFTDTEFIDLLTYLRSALKRFEALFFEAQEIGFEGVTNYCEFEIQKIRELIANVQLQKVQGY